MIYLAGATGYAFARYIEDVERSVIDVKVDEVFDTPTHGGAQFLHRYIRRFGQKQGIFRLVQYGGTGCAFETVIRCDTRKAAFSWLSSAGQGWKSKAESQRSSAIFVEDPQETHTPSA